MSHLTLHATTIAFDEQGVLILGASGAGKSSLALQLIAYGAELVSDDQTMLERTEDAVRASAPPTITGLIEARGVGLLNAPVAGPTPLSLVVDLDQSETERLPHPHDHTVLGVTYPCLWGISGPHFAPAILLYLKGCISDPA